MNKDVRDNINAKRIIKGKKELQRQYTTQTLDIGTNIRFQTGLPLTPFDLESSSLVYNWNRFGQGLLDFNQLNSQRGDYTFGIDIRIDYKWFFPKWSFNLYLDIQNIPGLPNGGQALILDLDQDGNPQIVNPGQANASYQLRAIEPGQGVITPTLGIIVQY